MSRLLMPAILENYRPRKDGSVGLSFSTQELNTNQVMEIHKLIATYGIIHFKAGDKLSASEITELDSMNVDLQTKSQAQRLRNTIYRRWEQDATRDGLSPEEIKAGWPEQYRIRMDVLIEEEKSNLEPR
jgi:hypothetical protein